MTIIELLTEKGFVEGVDYSLSGNSLVILDQVRMVDEIIHHDGIPAELDAQGNEISPAIPAHDETIQVEETYQKNIPSLNELKAELCSKEDAGDIINAFLADKQELQNEEDSINLALVLSGDESGWRCANIPCPSISELFDLIEPAKAQAAALNLKENKIKAGKEAREVCEKVLDLVAGYNLDRQLTLQQITQMQSTLSNAEAALRAGRPTYAKDFISAIVVDDVLVTQEMKDLCLQLLEGY